MITERQELGMISILDSGHIQVREDTIIERDVVEIARTYHRRTYSPGEHLSPVPGPTQVDLRIRKVATLIGNPAWADR